MKEYLGTLWGFRWKRKYVQLETGEKFSEELLCDVCIPLTVLYLSSHTASGKPFWRKRYQVIFRSMLMPMVKWEIASDKNWKEAFYKTALWYVYSSHIDKAFFTLCSLETLSWTDPQRDILEHIQDCGEKGNIFRWKLERSFLWICFLLCLFISHR